VSTRDPDVVLAERAAFLAFLATEAMYGDQPQLWEMGEHGRQNTHNDFKLHFEAVASGEDAFRTHVEYCYELFEGRKFPRAWLDDAWQVMRRIGEAQLEDPARQVFLERMTAVTSGEGH
jgi:hypothetical protein